MTHPVRESNVAKLVQVLLALVFTVAALLISEFSARQLQVESPVSVSTEVDHSAERQ